MITSSAPVSCKPGDVTFNSWLAQSSVLIVDDERGMRNFLTRTLLSRCEHVAEAADVPTAARLLEEEHYDLDLLDNTMPGKKGVNWLLELRDSGFFGEVILITAFADLDTAIQALRAGASDFLLKPFRSNKILNAIARCLDRSQLRRENFVLRRELQKLPSSEQNAARLVGKSDAMRHVREMVNRLAPLPTTVLITGESGTGKEATARALHMHSPRAEKPFVPVNCAAIPPDIIAGGQDLAPARSEALKELEKNHMLDMLAAVGGNRTEAARRLGISRTTLDRKCAVWNV